MTIKKEVFFIECTYRLKKDGERQKTRLDNGKIYDQYVDAANVIKKLTLSDEFLDIELSIVKVWVKDEDANKEKE